MQSFFIIDGWLDQIKGHEINVNIMVTGALGRCGQGACSILDHLGIGYDTWTHEDTKRGRSFDDFLKYNIIIHCAVSNNKVTSSFLTREQLVTEHSIKLVCDVTCDTGSPNNLIPIYDHNTSFNNPASRIDGGVNIIAINHLPTLFAREASEAFSTILTDLILNPNDPCWDNSRGAFQVAIN